MSVLTRTKVLDAAMRVKIVAAHRCRRKLVVKNRRMVQKAIAKRQFESAEQEVTEALIPFFVEQGRSMVARLQKTTASNSASKLVAKIFDPMEWREELTNQRERKVFVDGLI